MLLLNMQHIVCRSVQLYLSKGASPNLVGSKGVAAIHLAVGKETEKNIRCLKMLLQNGADPNISYPESDYSFSSRSSMISDFGEAPLSSTRLSSFSNLSNINGRQSCRGVSFNRPSVLSSTRISAAGPAATTAAPKEDASCFEDALMTKDDENVASTNGTISPSRSNAPPEFFSRRASRKSVSFRNIDEFFPVFSPESSKQSIGGKINQCMDTLPFDMSEYSDFLDSGRLATVLPQQGIDVTSPDHVFVYSRESSESTEEDLEKTVVSHCTLKLSDDETEGQNNKEPPVDSSKRQEQPHVGSSSSGTSNSHYSSCESDHYTSCLDAPVPTRHPAFSLGAEFDKKTKQAFTDSENELLKEDKNIQAEPKTHSKPETIQPLSGLLDKLIISEEQHSEKDVLEACSGSFLSTARRLDVVREDAKTSEENTELKFKHSPFVTSRTRSRLSHCSMRASRTPESLLITSSLFEDTLPTPVRTFRQTPRSQGSGHCFNSPNTPSHTSDSSERCTEGDLVPEESQDMQSSTLRGPSVSNSQADTLILHKSVTDSAEGSQSLNDTVMLDKIQDDSVDAYERNLAEIILAVRGQNRDLSKDGEFLTDDLTSSDEAKAEDPTAGQLVDDFKNHDVWVTEDYSSGSNSASSSSTSSCFSPRRSTEDSDPSCTPGTGCTPRYSMSRLSSSRRPLRPADLSFTPGGRPVIQDPDEPVEYLYTDTEQGHKLIETHIPPTSDTSLTSSTSFSDETVLYDWCSLQTEIKTNKGKENQQPEMLPQEEELDKSESNMLPETRGMTDKELRLKLVELGVSPGPISSRTRPTYLKRLCRLLQEENCNTQHHKKQSDHPHKGNIYLLILSCSQ
ncbi:hypothetical protein XENOCAPTIV_010741 [Xenoophorus captivus]|uniref:LEM domain-containing protein n=1 Tax=Xenoophorus captivus TaxID=1517983 RepID=A0ABV0R843_9TELE